MYLIFDCCMKFVWFDWIREKKWVKPKCICIYCTCFDVISTVCNECRGCTVSMMMATMTFHARIEFLSVENSQQMNLFGIDTRWCGDKYIVNQMHCDILLIFSQFVDGDVDVAFTWTQTNARKQCTHSAYITIQWNGYDNWKRDLPLLFRCWFFNSSWCCFLVVCCSLHYFTVTWSLVLVVWHFASAELLTHSWLFFHLKETFMDQHSDVFIKDSETD